MTIQRVSIPFIISLVLSGCWDHSGRGSSNSQSASSASEPVIEEPSGEEPDAIPPQNESPPVDPLQDALDSIIDPQIAITACANDEVSCDEETSALASSVYDNMSGFFSLELTPLVSSMEQLVDYGIGLAEAYQATEFRVSDDSTINSVSLSLLSPPSGDDYNHDGPTPIVSYDQGVYADANLPGADPGGDNGWYYRNPANQKINWYIYGDFGGHNISYTVSDLESLSARVTHFNESSQYFFAIYTLPEGDGKDAQSWYRSRINIVLDHTGVVADQTYVGQYDRDNVLDDGDLDLNYRLLESNLSDGGNIASIGAEKIMLIAFSTSSSLPAASNDFLLKRLSLGLAGETIDILPVVTGEVSDMNLAAIIARSSTSYLSISSNTDTFDGLLFKVTRAGGYHFEPMNGAVATLPILNLLKKLDRGNGFNAMLPEPLFDNTDGALIYDFSTILAVADIEGLQASIYADEAQTVLWGTIYIDVDGQTTSRDIVP